METTEKREHWIDVLRGFAILLVVIGHANGVPAMLQTAIYKFHTALFFFLSGYLFRPEKHKNFSEAFEWKYRRYIVPYFAMGLVNLGLNAVREARGMGGMKLLRSTAEHLVWLVYSYGNAKKMPNCTPLWFLPCLFLSSVFLYAFLHTLREHPEKRVHAYLAGILAGGGSLYWIANRTDQLPWHLDIAVLGAGLMLLGYLWRVKGTLCRVPPSGAFVLLVIGLGTGYVNPVTPGNALDESNLGEPLLWAICVTATALALLTLFRRYDRMRLPLLTYLGRNTMIVMGFSYAFKTFASSCLKRMSLTSEASLYWLIQTALVLAMCFASAWLWNKAKERFPRIAIF